MKSSNAEYPAAHMPKIGYISGDQHVPSRYGFQVLATGVQRNQRKSAFRYMAMLAVMMKNHSRAFISPCISFNKVRAKEVLLQTAASMENVPVILPRMPR